MQRCCWKMILHPNIIVHVENVVSLFSSPSTSSQKVRKCGSHNFLSQAIHTSLPHSLQAHSQFSSECARYKDLIHLHSFMHDFHLNLVLGMVCGEREVPDWLDLKAFLDQFTRENVYPPTFNRNRLERGTHTHTHARTHTHMHGHAHTRTHACTHTHRRTHLHSVPLNVHYVCC